ncbi:radical SAM additional 4Fe4S-binding SPASM domain-containing protein [Streptococcus equinus]|uniref:Radical SAM additional 4Fe4S-binding SPASM domain-containing protein n=1 Tax=Streptococcus equinus TaxID=1335 RepID=A0A239R6W1_STREI|nr:radical SAM protein [Streptococcus equinus]SNU06361.1 radical SAM additional 4Fe4S-binding SPASM domain-containing protein [Streptococcus equinus]
MKSRFSIFYNSYYENGLIIDKIENVSYVINRGHYLSLLFLKRDKFVSSETTDYPKILQETITFCKEKKLIEELREISFNVFSEKIPLKTVQLQITSRCNLRCKHCYIGDYDSSLKIEDVLGIVDEAKKMGVVNFDLTGGEPLAYKGIEKVIKSILDNGMKTVIFSNAMRIPDGVKSLIKNYSGISMKVSLDGWDEESHDYIRGKGNFRKTMENIEFLKENSVPLFINVVLNSKNIKGMDKFIKLSESLNIPFIFDRFIPFARNTYLSISDEDYIQALIRYDKFKFHCDKTTLKNADLSEFYCGAGNSYVYINSIGDVGFCPTLSTANFCGGNVLKQSLSSIWNDSVFFNHIRNIRCSLYSLCPVNYFCKGGCRSRGEFFGSDITSPDLQICKLAYKITGIYPASFSGGFVNDNWI